MQTKREYLSSLTPPLAKAGARGKFSKAAHAALAEAIKSGMTFSDDIPAEPKRTRKAADKAPERVPTLPADESTGDPAMDALLAREREPYVPVVPPKQTKVRSVKQLSGFTTEGWSVGFASCQQCSQHVNYCRCNGGPLAPKMITQLPEGSPARLFN